MSTKRALPASSSVVAKHPEWVRARMPGLAEFNHTQKVLQSYQLNTVCEEAQCPNRSECYAHRTATFMILGNICTRRCSFCAVSQGTPPRPPDPDEPVRLARAVVELGLKHVVITSVDRDDLPDQGAGHFADCVRSIKAASPHTQVELLIPDFRGDVNALRVVLDAPLAVLGHNVETVPRLYAKIRRGARYERSVQLLAAAKRLRPKVFTKTGIMLGLGETREEVLQVLSDLREAKVDILTIGQYLQPTGAQVAVAEYVAPYEFDNWKKIARKIGFAHVEAGPLVRSSYHAWQQVRGLQRGKSE